MYTAREKWREYVAAEKIYRKPEYTDLKKVYKQLKDGQKIIDIFKVIAKAGVHANHHPKMAIARADRKELRCRYHHNGNVDYYNEDTSWRGKERFHLQECLPAFDRTKVTPGDWSMDLKAPVPIIPGELMPKKLTDDYYILWEVEEWRRVPPTDPWLLRRITKTLFVVVAGWDLTELEKAVMHGRMY